MLLELVDWTGLQVQPGKRGSVARNVPPILDRLNLSPDLWLQTIAGFAKRRSANSVTPASRFNAAAKILVQSQSIGVEETAGKFHASVDFRKASLL